MLPTQLVILAAFQMTLIVKWQVADVVGPSRNLGIDTNTFSDTQICMSPLLGFNRQQWPIDHHYNTSYF